MHLRYILALFIFSFSSLQAQLVEPVKWKFESTELGNDEFELKFIASIDKGWTVYSQFTSDDGPVPTSINYESEGFEMVGKSTEVGNKKEGKDKLFGVNVIKFLGGTPFVITQKVKVTDHESPISGYLTFMTCDDSKCLAPTDVDFSFSLRKGVSKPLMKDIIPSASPPKKTDQTPEKQVEQIEEPEKLANTKAPIKTETKTKTFSSETLAKNSATVEEKKEAQPQVENSTSQLNADESTSSNSDQKEDGIIVPVTWDFEIEKLSEDSYNLIYKAEVIEGWTIYSQFTSEDGPVPTTIEYETVDGYSLDGESKEEGKKKEGMDKLFGVEVIKFYGGTPFKITQKIKTTDSSLPIKGYLTYMACDDSKCLAPTSVDFQFSPDKMYAGLPIVGSNASVANIENGVIDQIIPKIKASLEDPLGACGGEDLKGKNLFWTFLFGFIGGLVALLTPCVFPMIPLTISFFTKDKKRKGWVNGLIYGVSIIVIYVTLGLLLTIFFGEEALNRLSTNWIANTIFFLIFVFFAFSFFGFYEITLPSSWSNKSDRMADKGGIIGIFFMAFTLAIVSFSCTGPIIGTAIVEAAETKIGPSVVMLGFATALAIPFGLFAAFPAWLNTLPSSGSWMNSVKVVLGFVELALAFKFLSVADMTNNWGFLRYELFMGIWVIIGILLTLYLFGLIKFPHDSPLKKRSATRWAFTLGSLAFTIYMITGFQYNDKTNAYNSLAALSGIAPPAHYNFFLPPPELDPDLKARFSSYTKCANNLDCFKDYYEGVSYARETKKPILLDFTGHGCVNCRKTEEHIWIKDDIWESLKNDFVMIALYCDDDKKLDEVFLSKSRGNKIRNVGNKWADFQIVNFGSNSQPLYVMMTPEEEVLGLPRGYHPDHKGYREFLNCGLEACEKRPLLGSND